MNLERLCKDSVTIIKKDGTRIGPFKCVFTDFVMIFTPELDVDPGDSIERELPGGKVRTHVIADYDYSPGLSSIKPHYKLKLKKDSHGEPVTVPNTTINISNSTGFQVGDHNNLHIENAISDLIQKIDQGQGSPEEKAEAKGRVAALLKHPLVGTVIGGAVQGLVKLATS